MRYRTHFRHGGSIVVLLPGVLLAGCASPLFDSPDTELKRSVTQAAGRELIDAQVSPGTVRLNRESRVESLGLKPSVMEELEQMAGPNALGGKDAPLGDALTPKEDKVVTITLERAIRSTVTHNLNVQFARLAPAINEARMVAAQAAFDWVFFANTQWNSTDEPRIAQLIGGSVVGVTSDQRQVITNNLGVRRRLTTGGQFTAQTGFNYTDVNTKNLITFPDPAYEPNIVLQLDQPLMRNFGSDTALAQVRLQRNSERDQIQNLRVELIKAVADTEEAYWTLVRAKLDLEILKRLLDRGVQVREVLAGRRQLDVKPSQYSDAAANVERRQANVIRAQRSVRLASNRLKQQMNDPELTVGSEVLLLPGDAALDAPIEFSLADSMMTALAKRPEVQRALLSIDDTSIRQQVADNARLPMLDLRAQTRFSALGNETSRAYKNLAEARFVDYLIGLTFEQPIGNREAEANFRGRRLERMQATISYNNTVQGIVREVKDALVDVATNYSLIGQTRLARIAAAENLRTLQVEERTTGTLDPFSLDQKLRRQEALSQAEQDEAQALVDYNNSLSRLYAALGTSLERNRIKFEVPDAQQLVATNPLFPIPYFGNWNGFPPPGETSAAAAEAKPEPGAAQPEASPAGGSK